MNSVNTQRTTIEDLANEIFREIFEFLSLEEIVTSFFGLNSRINSIIRSMNTASHAINSNDTKAVDLLNLFPIQIGRLILKYSENVNFTSLINLRSLTITFGSIAQFDDSRPEHFPLLEVLHIEASKSETNIFDKTRNDISNFFYV
jgi:hypothetical protein